MTAVCSRCLRVDGGYSSVSYTLISYINFQLPSESAKTRRSSSGTTTSSLCSFALHPLANLHIDVHVFCYASVETHRFAFVELGFAVVFGYALACAGLCESKGWTVSIGFDSEICQKRNATYLLYMSWMSSSSASAISIFWAEDICGFWPKRNDMMADV